MTKINFTNLPDTSTPINATNMNQLQINVENAINATQISLENEITALPGEIIESGSNANGEYIKFSNGKMICYKHMDYGEKAITKQWGSFYESDKLTIGNYPQAFIEIPRIFIMDLNFSFIEKEHNSITETSWGNFYSTRPVSSTQRVVIDCFAIGKWK